MDKYEFGGLEKGNPRASLFIRSSSGSQVPPGEFAIVYLAYTEGAREEIADQRLAAFKSRVETWSHEPGIRIPVAFLNRLFPRPLDEGRPDLIASTVLILSELYGESALLEDFPPTVFTFPPRD